MFIVDFRNTLVSKYCFSVMNNNDVDVVHIYSHFVQYANYLCYLKVESEDKDYVDEFLIDSENIEVVDNALLVKWTMGEISTQCKKINIQLEFRESNAENSKIAQTKIVSIVLADTIDTSEGSKRLYPNILKYLQEQIDTLKDDSVAGFTMSYVSDVLTINLKNANDKSVTQLQVNIPTDKAIVGVSFVDRVITFTANDGTTKQVDLSNIYTKTEIDNLLAVKVDKTTEHNKVYGTDNSGTQTVMPVDNGSGYGGNVVRRDSDSQVNVPVTPTANSHATSKGYVDQLVANIKKDSYKEVDTTEYPTLNDFLASTGEEGYLYLYPIDTTDLTKGYYRYVWESNAWLDLGTTKIDLSDYTTDQEFEAHTGNTNNPHNVTKAQVGLGNVDNTSDMNKPVSTAQQQALNEKQNDVCLSVVDGKLCITYEA